MPAFAIKIREADDAERRHIEVQLAEHLASDHCIGIWLDDELIGWGDDYGTFHPMRPSLQRQEAGEATAGGGAGLLGGRAAMTDHPSQSVASSESPIRARTKDERMALLVGFDMALEMVEKNGTEAAREWLRTTVESEERISDD